MHQVFTGIPWHRYSLLPLGFAPLILMFHTFGVNYSILSAFLPGFLKFKVTPRFIAQPKELLKPQVQNAKTLLLVDRDD